MSNKEILRRKRRVRSKMSGEGYRLTVSRSNQYLFAQVIERKTGKTVLGLSEKKILGKEAAEKTKTERAKIFGLKFSNEAQAKKIEEVVFDRGPYQYHGRIRAFAEGAREGGLKF